MMSNWSAHAGTQQQVAAARRVLRVGSLGRFAIREILQCQ